MNKTAQYKVEVQYAPHVPVNQVDSHGDPSKNPGLVTWTYDDEAAARGFAEEFSQNPKVESVKVTFIMTRHNCFSCEAGENFVEANAEFRIRDPEGICVPSTGWLCSDHEHQYLTDGYELTLISRSTPSESVEGVDCLTENSNGDKSCDGVLFFVSSFAGREIRKCDLCGQQYSFPTVTE